MKYDGCSPEIAGYILRQKDFDKAEHYKLLLSGMIGGVFGILGVLIGILFE